MSYLRLQFEVKLTLVYVTFLPVSAVNCAPADSIEEYSMAAKVPNMGISYSPDISSAVSFQVAHLIQDTAFPILHSAVWATVIPVMHKLSAMNYHLKNYREIEDRRYAILSQLASVAPTEELELIFELEGFFVQMKSSVSVPIQSEAQLG